MYTAISGFIGLDGSVRRPRPANDIQAYAAALYHYQVSLRLNSRLQERVGTERKPTGRSGCCVPHVTAVA